MRTTELVNGMPMWVKAVAAVGLPGVMALGLLWVLASGLPSDVAAMRTEITEHRRESEQMLRVLQQICVNLSATDRDRAGCFPQASN